MLTQMKKKINIYMGVYFSFIGNLVVPQERSISILTKQQPFFQILDFNTNYFKNCVGVGICGFVM